MIAAVRRRIRLAPQTAKRRIRRAPQALRRGAREAPQSAAALTRRVDRWANGKLARMQPVLARRARRARAVASRWAGRLGRWARPPARMAFRALAFAEPRLRRLGARTKRATIRLSAVITPERAICAVIVASSIVLIASQFVDYRGVEIGEPGYVGLPDVASPPATNVEWAGQAHAFLLIPIAILAAALAFVAARRGRRGLGRLIFLLGLLSLAVTLLVDLPAGLDAGTAASRFSGATAVLYGGFYGELAAAAGLMLGGLLLVLAPKAAARYHARPCRTRTNLYARAASALRRRRRRRASSRGRAARRRSRRRSGEVSAPASRP